MSRTKRPRNVNCLSHIIFCNISAIIFYKINPGNEKDGEQSKWPERVSHLSGHLISSFFLSSYSYFLLSSLSLFSRENTSSSLNTRWSPSTVTIERRPSFGNISSFSANGSSKNCSMVRRKGLAPISG